MFTVYKPQTALTELLPIWIAGDPSTRASIETALLEVEKRLQRNPLEEGESRAFGVRVLFQSPIAVNYEIDEPRRLVRILRVWTYRRAA
jgi:hypothetical protein